jgi:branched-chain amino acid transport system permease protein
VIVTRLFNRPQFLLVALAIVVLVLPLLLPSTYYVRVVTLVFINALAVLGLNLLMGFAGQVSLGHAGFFGIGAYSVALAPTYLGVPVWLSLIAGTVLSGAIAFLIGRPILKLKGYYLAVATLGFGMLVAMVISNEAAITGGPNGMPVERLTLFGWRVSGAQTWYWVASMTLLLAAWIAVSLIDSSTGRALRAIHDSETAARVLGIDAAKYKLLAFVVSAVFASIAGAYLVLFDGFATPDTASFLRSIEFVVMAVVGGLGSILGSIVGAAFLVILPQVLTVFHDYEHIVLGIVIIVSLIFLPRGIVPSVSSLVARRAS